MAFFKSIKQYAQLLADLSRTFFQMLRGVYHISHFPQSPVTIFGGSRLKMDSNYMESAHWLAHKLAAENIPVLTGGGPGIMEAANCGALHEKSSSTTVGISVKGLLADGTESFNCCASTQITMDHFYSRKWLLMRYSIGFAVFPGGYGTFDELFGILTLIKTHEFKKVPVVLYGKEYWQGLTDWLVHNTLEANLIEKDDLHLFYITDDIDEALKILVEHCKVC